MSSQPLLAPIPEPRLTDREREVLRAVYMASWTHQATDKGHRILFRGRRPWHVSTELADSTFRRYIRDLSHRGLVRYTPGRGGGSRLSPIRSGHDASVSISELGALAIGAPWPGHAEHTWEEHQEWLERRRRWFAEATGLAS
jgi:hypothetical protein